MAISSTKPVKSHRTRDEKARRQRDSERMARWRAENRHRPDSRTCDLFLVEALAETLRQVPSPELFALIEQIHGLARDGLVRRGYDAKAAHVALAGRIRAKAEAGDTNVAIAARDKRSGRQVGVFLRQAPDPPCSE